MEKYIKENKLLISDNIMKIKQTLNDLVSNVKAITNEVKEAHNFKTSYSKMYDAFPLSLLTQGMMDLTFMLNVTDAINAGDYKITLAYLGKNITFRTINHYLTKLISNRKELNEDKNILKLYSEN
ncbi:MAG: hypothetical protein WC755_02740 [Candidatus Woesearchaeota archaeon]|jgi:hypothetical protein